MYGTFWLLAGFIAVIIIGLSNMKLFMGMLRNTNYLIVLGLFVLAILGGGFTLVAAIGYAALSKVKA